MLFFCVLFGCLGSEVAQYVAKKLPEVLKNTASYQRGEIKQSMVDCFLEVDQLIISDEVCEWSVMYDVLQWKELVWL